MSASLADKLDGTTLGTVLDECTSNGSVDLKLFAEYSSSNAEDFCHFLRNLFVALLVKEHVVVKLVPDLHFGPTLLFSLSTFLTCLSGL